MKHSPDYMPLKEGEDEEDHISNIGSKPDGPAGVAGTEPTRAVRFWRICLICGMLVSLATGGTIIGLGVSRNNKKNIGNISRYPTDFLRDVVPIPCHSHNDYWRTEPLFSALRAGCIGVEADVWLLDSPSPSSSSSSSSSSSDLLVGHDTAALTARRTFASLYVERLVELLALANPRTPFFHGGARRGVFDVDPAQTLVLLVDVKTDGAATWRRVLEQLEPLRSRGWLTRFEDGGVRRGPVTVVGTGNAPFGLLARNATFRDAFFDAPLAGLGGEREGDGKDYDYTNSFYASAGFKDVVGPISRGELSEDQLRIIRGHVSDAHSRGLKARYWETPSWPIALRNKVWHVLVEEGVDILNVDDLHAASQSAW